MSSDKDVGSFIAMGIACLMLGFVVGGLILEDQGRNEIRREAVTQGVAEWIPDKDGKPEFKWITKEKQK